MSQSLSPVVPRWRRVWLFKRLYWRSWQVGHGWQTELKEHDIRVVLYPFLGGWRSRIHMGGPYGPFVTGQSHPSAAQAMRYVREYIERELDSH